MRILTCQAETAGYDGMFGVYCDLPRDHDGPHRDSGIVWYDETYEPERAP